VTTLVAAVAAVVLGHLSRKGPFASREAARSGNRPGQAKNGRPAEFRALSSSSPSASYPSLPPFLTLAA